MMIRELFNLCKQQLLVLAMLVWLPVVSFALGQAEQNNISKTQKFEGYQVQFDYKNFPAERAIAYQYYKENYSFDAWHPLEEGDIGIDIYDIDDDSEKEIITYLQNGGYCGSAGCRFHILKRTSETNAKNGIKYESIAQGQIYDEIKVLNTKTSKYHDLLIEDKRGTYIWGWNGAIYKVKTEIEESDWGKSCLEDAWGNKRL